MKKLFFIIFTGFYFTISFSMQKDTSLSHPKNTMELIDGIDQLTIAHNITEQILSPEMIECLEAVYKKDQEQLLMEKNDINLHSQYLKLQKELREIHDSIELYCRKKNEIETSKTIKMGAGFVIGMSSTSSALLCLISAVSVKQNISTTIGSFFGTVICAMLADKCAKSFDSDHKNLLQTLEIIDKLQKRKAEIQSYLRQNKV